MTETRYQRVAREQRERQAAREARRAKAQREWDSHSVYGRKRRSQESYEDRLDDLGESPDY